MDLTPASWDSWVLLSQGLLSGRNDNLSLCFSFACIKLCLDAQNLMPCHPNSAFAGCSFSSCAVTVPYHCMRLSHK